MKEVSKEFLAALSMGGALVAECVCGHTHFATNHEGQGHYDKGELNRLLSLAEADPKRYTEHADCDSVYVAYIRGVNYVVDCPCGRLLYAEKFAWDMKNAFLQYYRLRIDKERAEAEKGERLLTGLETGRPKAGD
ncbi:MAG TPA: hypothetical protein DCS05_12610 [Nitrospiraceae bacterium]|nr:hypothetical protein [Nitrospiraceae bacterium]